MFVTQIQGFKSGSGGITEHGPISELRFWCKALDGTGSFVGRSAGKDDVGGSMLKARSPPRALASIEGSTTGSAKTDSRLIPGILFSPADYPADAHVDSR
jgi:hypothetical protein